jgi:NDP-sugar pyrophosphorylase family protein
VTQKKINHALIMAAGRGMRMMPLTDKIPKAMAPHGESTLIANGIKKLQTSFKNIYITVGYKGAMLASHVIEHDVSAVFNTEGRGTAWWLYNTLVKNIDEPLLVLTCDNVIEMDFDLFLKDYYELGSPACLVVPVKPIKGIEGDFIFKDKENYVQELSRSKNSDLYCSGIQIINPYKINQLTHHEEDFNLVWSQLISKKQMLCSTLIPDEWCSVDDLDQLDQINNK